VLVSDIFVEGRALVSPQRRLLDSYRRPDGSRWTVQQIDEATGGAVGRSYFTNLGRGV
jgi:hypothetical protein